MRGYAPMSGRSLGTREAVEGSLDALLTSSRSAAAPEASAAELSPAARRAASLASRSLRLATKLALLSSREAEVEPRLSEADGAAEAMEGAGLRLSDPATGVPGGTGWEGSKGAEAEDLRLEAARSWGW